MNSNFEGMQKVLKEREDKINVEIQKYVSHIDAIVEKSLNDQLTNKLRLYENVSKNFSQFFSQDDLGSLIDRKADIELITRMKELKADRTEVSSLQRDLHTLVDEVDVKLRHITVF